MTFSFPRVYGQIGHSFYHVFPAELDIKEKLFKGLKNSFCYWRISVTGSPLKRDSTNILYAGGSIDMVLSDGANSLGPGGGLHGNRQTNGT